MKTLMSHFHTKGQVTMIGAVVVATLTMIGGVFSAKITADSAIKEQVAIVRQETAIVSTKVDLNERNGTARLDRLEDKIDWLIQQQGGIPSLIAK